MFKVSALASGSKGNAFLIKTAKTKILLDAGLSGKSIFNLMNIIDLEKENLKAIIVSHEHSDHTKGAGIVCRKLKIPLYITQSTYFASKKTIKVVEEMHHFSSDTKIVIDDLIISPFQSSHDAVDSHNFVIEQADNSEQKLAIVTDLGYVHKLYKLKLRDVTTILLESNHDPEMLRDGPYPWSLKQRVKGRAGHLSNEQAVGLVVEIISPKLKNLVLVHLSETNNDPDIAYSTMKNYLDSINSEVNVIVSNPHNPTKLIDV